ncbi:hypothetical protein GCM10008949_47510 [Deinococcus humi]|nr:hypothetical protein GCM10008949_47510 [Deinococcus humi]
MSRTTRAGWVLRAYTPGPDERVKINLIAHALVTGQVYADRGRRPDTSPDPESQEMAPMPSCS